jgi:prepilin-type N-terminal cleavage/methylation domain-containing protein
MKLQKSHAVRKLAHKREGFTLIELLIVMSIITLLAALLAGATILYIGRQYESNTRGIIGSVSKELDWQWRSVVEDARAEYKSGNLSSNVLDAVNNMATPPGGGLDEERAQVIWSKCRLRQQFPMNYTEIGSPVVLPSSSGSPVTVLPTVVAYQSAMGNRAQASNPPKPSESGAALLMALTAQSRHGRLTNKELFGTQAIQDPENDGVPKLVDGWGHPLVFYRWATANPELDALNVNNSGSTRPPFQDPCDQQGRLMADNWNNQPNSTAGAGCKQFELIFHFIHDPNNPTYTPRSWYLIPVIASAGSDGQLGIAPVSAGSPDAMLINDQAHANDNIYSYNVVPR